MATDNSMAAVNVTGTHASGEMFNIGVTTVTYIAVDESGNMATCSFNVTVTGKISEIATSDYRITEIEPVDTSLKPMYSFVNSENEIFLKCVLFIELYEF